MPFRSKKQIAKCFAMKKRNPHSTWDCAAWLRETTSVKALPTRVRKRKSRR